MTTQILHFNSMIYTGTRLKLNLRIVNLEDRMSTSMEKNEIKRTGLQNAPEAAKASKEVIARQAVNDFINEGNPTVSPPEVDEKKVKNIITKLSDS